MRFKLLTLVAATAACTNLSAAALAQEAPSQAGKVLETGGPVGAVLVLRGAQSYALQADDLLFDNDRVFTRSNGTVRLVAYGCERSLDPAASIVIDDQVCKVAPMTLAGNLTVSGAQLAAATAVEAASSVGSTPTWLPLLASGGAAAAAGLAAAGAGVID